MKLKGLMQKVRSHALARDSAIVFVGSMVANVGSYVYHLLMGRLLGPAVYGEFSSLLSILYIFTVPLLVGQTVLIKFISGFKAHGEEGQAKSLFVGVTKNAFIVSLIGLPVAWVAAPSVTAFLHLPSTTLFMMVYVLFVVSLLTITTTSMLQGYQKFLWFSVLTSGAVIVKVAISMPLVKFGIVGVLGAAIVAALIMYGLYFVPLGFVLRKKALPTKLTVREAFGFAAPTLLSLIGITSIYSTDIILVRHFFLPQEAGLYAALAILGKIIFYASSSVALVLFPVLSERSAKGTETKTLVFSSITAVAAISIAITVGYFLFPNFIVKMLFGNSFVGAGALLGMFGVFIAFFSIGNIVINACLGIGKTGIWIVPIICAIFQIIAISMFHSSVSIVITINILVSIVLAVGSLGYYLVKVYEKI
jgi:O-antigen/teichoic acid export membrane protein